VAALVPVDRGGELLGDRDRSCTGAVPLVKASRRPGRWGQGRVVGVQRARSALGGSADVCSRLSCTTESWQLSKLPSYRDRTADRGCGRVPTRPDSLVRKAPPPATSNSAVALEKFVAELAPILVEHAVAPLIGDPDRDTLVRASASAEEPPIDGSGKAAAGSSRSLSSSPRRCTGRSRRSRDPCRDVVALA